MPQRCAEPASIYHSDSKACRALLREGSRTFHAAAYLLPARVREPACALYAFCRVADDAIDGEGSDDSALAHLHERLDAIYAGRPLDYRTDRAFADVVARFTIPRTLPDALLEGFAWDQSGRQYEDLSALQDYAARVAGTVGAMMALLMGAHSRAAVARACDLGVAMQLSNIARDVGEDARNGRLYLPHAWMREAGIDPQAWLARPAHSPALGAVVQRLLATADGLYARVGDGVAMLPRTCRPGINAARMLYAEIGHEVSRRAGDGVSRRAVVTPRRKLRVLGRALATRSVRSASPIAPPLPETRFLVDAVADAIARRATGRVGPSAPWWNLYARWVTVLDIFERLETRQRVQDLRVRS
jgi:phytoene synthase